MHLMILLFSYSMSFAAPSAPTSLKWLMNGNDRFVKGSVRSDGQSFKDIQKQSGAEHPHAVVLSCSDSRVPPELVFDQKLGEVFTVRTLGERLDSAVVASIEYAVRDLGVKLIVVMGHTQCEAVKAAGGKIASPRFSKESWAQAEQVARDLIGKSSLLSQRWTKGDLWIVPSQYDLSTGEVSFREKLSVGLKRTLSSR